MCVSTEKSKTHCDYCMYIYIRKQQTQYSYGLVIEAKNATTHMTLEMETKAKITIIMIRAGSLGESKVFETNPCRLYLHLNFLSPDNFFIITMILTSRRSSISSSKLSSNSSSSNNNESYDNDNKRDEQ